MSYRSYTGSGYGYDPGNRTLSGEVFDLKWRISSSLHGMFSLGTGPTSPRQSVVAVRAISTTTAEAIHLHPQRVATGATTALTATVV